MTKELQRDFSTVLEDIAAQKHQQVDEQQSAIDREAEAMTNGERFADFMRDMRLL